MDKLLSTFEVAELLGVQPDWVRRRCQAGELAYIRLGGSRGPLRIRERDLEAFIAARVVEAKRDRIAPARRGRVRRTT